MKEILSPKEFNELKEIIFSIRESVFINEQGVPEELEIDGLDQKCKHILIENSGQYVGTGRIQRDGHIGRVAILKDYRGTGLGKEVIKGLINIARRDGLKKVYLGAQLTAVDFYIKLGFKEYGEIFLDADIDHIMMDLDLD